MKTIAISFGRFNPPHVGHLTAWNMAKQHTDYIIGTNPNTSGKKDPLTFEEKIDIIGKIDKDIASHVVPHTSWFTIVTEAYEKYPSHALVLITDEQWVVDSITKYNGVESNHGYYNFSKIIHEKSPRLTSATNIRQAVINNDIEQFAKSVGLGEIIDIHSYFDLVKRSIARTRVC